MQAVPLPATPIVVIDMEEFNKNVSEQDKKDYLGNILYPIVEELHQE